MLALLPTLAAAQADGGRPVTWNTYLGGDMAGGSGLAQDELEGIITSREGEVYVTGKTNAATFPGTVDGRRTASDNDILITRLSRDGGVLWSRVIGGPGEDVGRRVIFHHPNEGHLLVSGNTSSAMLRDGGFPVLGTYVSPRTPFLARVELNGTITWFMYLGGSGNDDGQDVAVFPDQEVAYVTGESAGDVFLTKVNVADAGPNIMWKRIFGTPNAQDVGYAVVTTPPDEDHVFVGGRVGSPAPLSNAPQPVNSFGGVSDGFVAAVEPDAGTVEWVHYLGGGQEDEVRDLLHQPGSGVSVAVIGNTQSPNYPPGTNGQGSNIFLARVTDAPSLVLGNYLLLGAGGETMQGHGSSDSLGNIYFGGTTRSGNFPIIKAFDSTFAAGPSNDDGFVAMVDNRLTRIAWSSYVGGPSSTSESVRGTSPVPRGLLTFIGVTSATDGVMETGVGADLSANGGQDGVIFRLTVDSRPPIAGTVQGRFNAQGSITGEWSGFYDEETDIDYAVELLEGPIGVDFSPFLYNRDFFAFSYTPLPSRTYRVRVTAYDLLNQSVSVTSAPVVGDPPDAGTPDAGPGGGDGGGGGSSDAGPEDNVPKESPLGWGCGSAGGGTLLAMGLLMVWVLLLSRRSARPER